VGTQKGLSVPPCFSPINREIPLVFEKIGGKGRGEIDEPEENQDFEVYKHDEQPVVV
jgi:hypothetical protein